uniref:Uncharacterized protein n=1 Tax=Triticum urartu TaxID=4572 RepID=A0A8R7R092_TRIUA
DGACLLPSPSPIHAPSELFSIRRLGSLSPPTPPFLAKENTLQKLVFSVYYLSVILGTAYLHPRLSLSLLSVRNTWKDSCSTNLEGK